MKKASFAKYVIIGILGWAVIVFGFYSFKKVRFFNDWTKGGYFRLESVKGRDVFIDPLGKIFYSKGMVYDYGPDKLTLTSDISINRVLEDLDLMKKYGFNTLNLYGNLFFDEILSWCDRNKIAVYPRADYTNLPDFPREFAEYPDFMDPQFREMAKHGLYKILNITKNHHSVLAIDMDQRWLFDVDWHGKERFGSPKLGPKSIEYLPVWLGNKYKYINELNKAWNKGYVNFSDVLKDEDIVIDNYIEPLGSFPWRIDLVEYTVWTINDFLKELTEYMRTVDPHHLITYTTDLPEVIPFPISTTKNSGIDFISAVHYNSKEDFNRDWISNAELIYMTKWLRDIYDMPVYINEIGFRTSSLEQYPSNMEYASAKKDNENYAAEMYLRYHSLINTYPWLLGWSYFKWYDKLMEGDFGYIRDDRSLKPVSILGQYINNSFSLNIPNKQKPLVWIYYPAYAITSLYPSYEQYKSLVIMLEDDFLSQYETMAQEAVDYMENSNYNKIAHSKLLNELSYTFNKKWLPFNFTSTIPDDDKPIILAGRALEQLSQSDRDKLIFKKTITIGPIGITDERYNDTENAYLSLLGLPFKILPNACIVKDALVTASVKEIVCSGITPWMVLIDNEETGNCKVLAAFSDGKPAIIQSNDGRHTAFLYDPLTWGGKDNEMSRTVSEHAKILKQILKEGGGVR